MNKIIPCFDEQAHETYKELVTKLANTNTGFFAGRKSAFNNNPLLVADNENTPFADKLNITALMRRVYIGTVVNAAPVEDVPTHILVASYKSAADAIDDNDEETKELISEFEKKDIPVPAIVFLDAGSEKFSEEVEAYMNSSVVIVSEEPVVEDTPIIEDTPVIVDTPVIEDAPVSEEPVSEEPVREKPVSKKKK